MPDLKILLVDDQRNHLRTIKQMFEKCGCKIVAVDSAEEAEFILEWKSDFHAIVTDLKMPWMDGVEFCKDTKGKYPELKIYALSGNLRHYKQNILDYAGFDGVYQKPIRLQLIEELVIKIKILVEDAGQ